AEWVAGLKLSPEERKAVAGLVGGWQDGFRTLRDAAQKRRAVPPDVQPRPVAGAGREGGEGRDDRGLRAEEAGLRGRPRLPPRPRAGGAGPHAGGLLDGADEALPEEAGKVRRRAALRRDADGEGCAGPGGAGRPRDRRGPLPRAAARHPVGGEGP